MLKQKMDATVAREYPETEAHLSEVDRSGHIPACILRMLDEAEAAHQRDEPEDGEPSAKRSRRLESVSDDKNATPGPPAQAPEQCLDDLRPLAVTMDRSNRSATDPATQRTNAFGECDEGVLTIHTKAKFVDTWQGFNPIRPNLKNKQHQYYGSIQ